MNMSLNKSRRILSQRRNDSHILVLKALPSDDLSERIETSTNSIANTANEGLKDILKSFNYVAIGAACSFFI